MEHEVTVQALMIDNIDNENLQEELESCILFPVDSESENAIFKVSNYARKTLGTKVVEEKPDQIFKKLKCAAEKNLAFGFISENLEEGRFKFFYAHESNTLLDWPKLVCTNDDLTELRTLSTKQTSSNRAVEERWTQTGNSASWQT